MFDLSDVTFIIPFSLDSPDRLRNLRISTGFLLRHFETRIVISEYASRPRLSLDDWPVQSRRSLVHRFFPNAVGYFQRTRCVNLAVQTISTPTFAIYDSDVLLPTRQILEAVRLLRRGDADMALPFSNRVMWIPQEGVARLPDQITDADLNTLDYETSDDDYIFLGLVNFLNTDSFVNAGMMNERFKSWGYEEMELYMRLVKLGYAVLRTRGHAYHLDHYRGADSSAHHEHFQNNQREYHRTLALNPDELRQAIRGWDWVKSMPSGFVSPTAPSKTPSRPGGRNMALPTQED